MRLWACTRADLRRGGAALALVVLIAGLAGGVTLAAVAGARRTETSYERLVEAEDPAEVFMFGQGELSPADLATLRSIPGARVGASTIILLSSAASGLDRRNDFGLIVAADAESLAMLRPHHLDGRLPSPDHPEEVVVNELVARELDVGPGDRIDLVGPTPAAFGCIEALECDGELLNEPLEVVVSGVMLRPSDLDPDAFNGALVHAGPGMLDLAPPDYVRAVTVVDAKLAAGPAGIDSFAAAVEARFPERFGIEADDPKDTKIGGTLDVEARSLLLFAVVTGIAGLVVTLQAFARHLAGGREDRRVLAWLGLATRDRAWVTARTALVVVVGATVTAVAVAVAGSALLPVGVARRAEPDPGIDVDRLVLGVGALAMASVLALALAAIVWRACLRDMNDDDRDATGARATLGRLPLVPGLGVDIVTPRRRRAGVASAVGAVVGAAAAMAIANAAAVIAESNHELQTTPELYGEPWDANVALSPDTARAIAADLTTNDEVTALAITPGGGIELIDEHGTRAEVVAVGFEHVRGEMEPVLLEGRSPRTPDEVALGSKLFDELDVSLGDSVTSGRGGALEIVGRAIVPIVSGDFPDEGALLTSEGFEAHATLDIQGEQAEVAVGFDVRHPADLAASLDDRLGAAVALVGAPARIPSDVTSLAGIGRFPGAIGAFTGVLAVAALSHALLVAVRRRRRDFATLRALGLRRRQGAAIVGWAGATVLVIGLAVGVPVGVAAGRLVWQAIADSIHVVDVPTVPIGSVAALAGVGLAATIVATAWPSVRVRRLRLAEALRTE